MIIIFSALFVVYCCCCCRCPRLKLENFTKQFFFFFGGTLYFRFFVISFFLNKYRIDTLFITFVTYYKERKRSEIIKHKITITIIIIVVVTNGNKQTNKIHKRCDIFFFLKGKNKH